MPKKNGECTLNERMQSLDFTKSANKLSTFILIYNYYKNSMNDTKMGKSS